MLGIGRHIGRKKRWKRDVTIFFLKQEFGGVADREPTTLFNLGTARAPKNPRQGNADE